MCNTLWCNWLLVEHWNNELPCNKGQTLLKIDILPIPKYWPNPYSINKSGMPIIHIIIMYGMRNAPVGVRNKLDTGEYEKLLVWI